MGCKPKNIQHNEILSYRMLCIGTRSVHTKNGSCSLYLQGEKVKYVKYMTIQDYYIIARNIGICKASTSVLETICAYSNICPNLVQFD